MHSDEKVAVVVVSYNRPNFLQGLLLSLEQQTRAPDWVVVVDNASTDHTQAIIESASAKRGGSLINLRQKENLGGAGGFSAGVAHALELGADWLWLMDDDVEALPDAIAHLCCWGQRFKCIHGRRLTVDGKPFFFQPHFSEWLGVPLPIPGDVFAKSDHIKINVGCFEGMFIHRTIAEQIGLPDPRFFLIWDDAVYGWLASKVTDVVLVDRFVLRRMRQQRQISLGIRHLNDASDLSRFYVMRNRAFVANYFRSAGVLKPFGFALGTGLTLMKELVRALVVERRPEGIKALIQGMRAARSSAKHPWKPMSPIPPSKAGNY
jgi:rhamnopyranosyl-N-acetylglucosaminyl-diphospho-decaprenol beta-1,3/1,4-galactofuranosyltransferase